MKTISLNGKWQLSGKPHGGADGNAIKMMATVPGCVQLDMSDAGYLPADLYMGENIVETEKYESYDWLYERTFTAPKERKNVFLVFRGVDCLAEYFLNGERIGESCDMFIPYEFEIGDKLKDGENTLAVSIKSPAAYIHKAKHELFGMGRSWMSCGDTVIRKAPHSFGWDIMPRALTSGIWRDVIIECRDDVYITQTFFDFDRKCCFSYDTESDFSDFHGMEIEVDARCEDSTVYFRKAIKQKAGRIEFDVQNKRLWWPYGYGEANVYRGAVRLYRDGELIHEKRVGFGIRSVELQHTDTTDGKNGCFRFIVNGKEVMCRGSNWVPLDAFHSRDKDRYAEALALVKDIGCNILRCWGGNVYEDEKFYDFCDANGIMIWQDFSMACHSYPQTDEFCALIHKEASTVIRALRHHPSIILWSGDNENDQMYNSFHVRPSLNKISREILPDAVYRNDLGRPYLESSPFISDEAFDDSTKRLPEDHLWGARDYYKSDFYKNSACHFVSETGYHGCPSMKSIRKFITKDKVWPYTNNPEWILHSSDQNGNDSRVMLMEYQVRQLFGDVPTDPDKYVLASQISQAEAKKFFIERVRSSRPYKSGIIWWNLLDGWPQMSDAVVDYYFEKKLAYDYIKRSQSPFALVLGELYDRCQRLFACNDTLSEKTGSYRVSDVDTGDILAEGSFVAPANSTTEIGSVHTEYHEKKMLKIEWCVDGVCSFNHYLCGFPPFSLEKYEKWMKKCGI